jgi:hypothetical protein
MRLIIIIIIIIISIIIIIIIMIVIIIIINNNIIIIIIDYNFSSIIFLSNDCKHCSYPIICSFSVSFTKSLE